MNTLRNIKPEAIPMKYESYIDLCLSVRTAYAYPVSY